jgi:hypothetical protein
MNWNFDLYPLFAYHRKSVSLKLSITGLLLAFFAASSFFFRAVRSTTFAADSEFIGRFPLAAVP